MQLFTLRTFWLILIVMQWISSHQAQSLNKTQVEPMPYVTGTGRIADDDYIWTRMISIRTRKPFKYFGDNHYCAGVIISKDLLVTAAHCVSDTKKRMTRPRKLTIVAGTKNRLVSSSATVQYPVAEVIPYLGYLTHLSNDDIAIVRIKGTFPNAGVIRIMPLPKTPPPYGSICTIAGWGRIYHDGPLSGIIRYLDLKLQTDKFCKNKTVDFYDGMLCTYNRTKYDDDPCRGDSGGPLVCNGILYGIISWAVSCGSWKYAAVYVDIYKYMDWINEVLSRPSENLAAQREINLSALFFSILCYIFL